MHKVLIIGIDGCSPRLVEQWQDELPNLKRIMEGGVHGDLESTIPPVTCPAWPCMFTGKNPGKIGMYGFINVETDGEYRISVNNSSNYHRWSLWKLLNDAGIKTGLLNVAVTFPPHKVDGFMVCGTGAPVSGKTDYTYPPSLKQLLSKAVPGYEIIPPIVLTIPGKEEKFKVALEQEVSNRLKAARYLMKTFPWQLFAPVFFVLDGAQHYFWHHMDNTHPQHQGGNYHDVIKGFYQQIDAAVGELLKNLAEEANVLIVSDHGFGPCYGKFVVSRWLEKEGLLTFTKPLMGNKRKISWKWRVRGFLFTILETGVIRLIVRIIPEWLATRLASREQSGYEVAEIYRSIDWSRTKAYPEGATYMIRVNLKGREPAGIVEPGQEFEALVNDIVSRLEKINDPQTACSLGVKAFKRGDIYHGKYAVEGPDVAFLMDKYMPMVVGNGQTEWDKPVYSGWHVRQGVFMAHGPDIKKSGKTIDNLQIYDITPTVLHMFGLPVPDDMDGRVLTEIFEPDSEMAKRAVAYEAAEGKGDIKGKIKELKDSGKI